MNRLETIYTHATCDKCGATNRWPDRSDVDRNHVHCGSCKVKLLRRNVEKLSI
jgi:RNase P subunit RPR2